VGMYEESGFLHPDEIKAKLMLFLNTPWRHTDKAEIRLHSFLTSALCGGEWSA
jgi:hypothetical protein